MLRINKPPKIKNDSEISIDINGWSVNPLNVNIKKPSIITETKIIIKYIVSLNIYIPNLIETFLYICLYYGFI